MAQVAFDTLDFANKLKAAGLDSRVAEVQAELQAELQAEVFKKIEEHEPIIEEIKASRNQFSTKEDIFLLKDDIYSLRRDFSRLENKVDAMRSEILIKLGGTIVGATAVLGTLMALFHFH